MKGEAPAWLAVGAWLDDPKYAFRFNRDLLRTRFALDRQLTPVNAIQPGANQDELLQRLRDSSPRGDARFRTVEVDLAGDAGQRARAYWSRYEAQYQGVGAPREKALEHALTLEHLDLARATRLCDVAAATSPLHHALGTEHPQLELWRQDLLYQTRLDERIIGGPAEAMGTQGVASGFFDALTLHCSFEHFAGNADVDFLREIDRVLGPTGACLILPLYLGTTHRVYFDPSTVRPAMVSTYDRDGELCPAWRYRQEHGRYYSPESLAARVLTRLPEGLRATLLCYRNQKAVDESVYLRFGMILHRQDSIARI